MFLTNHANVLLCLADRPDATLREVGDRLRITERAAHRIVKELVSAGVLRRYKHGRRNRYEIQLDAPVENPLAPHFSVGSLLAATGCHADAEPGLGRRKHSPEA